MIEHLKKIITSDLIINDEAYSLDDNLKFPWQWIANIDFLLKDIESSNSKIDNVVINESNGPVFIAIKTGPLDSFITTLSIFEFELSISFNKKSILAIHCHGNLRLSSKL